MGVRRRSAQVMHSRRSTQRVGLSSPPVQRTVVRPKNT